VVVPRDKDDGKTVCFEPAVYESRTGDPFRRTSRGP
jgi:hypothetical protein